MKILKCASNPYGADLSELLQSIKEDLEKTKLKRPQLSVDDKDFDLMSQVNLNSDSIIELLKDCISMENGSVHLLATGKPLEGEGHEPLYVPAHSVVKPKVPGVYIPSLTEDTTVQTGIMCGQRTITLPIDVTDDSSFEIKCESVDTEVLACKSDGWKLISENVYQYNKPKSVLVEFTDNRVNEDNMINIDIITERFSDIVTAWHIETVEELNSKGFDEASVGFRDNFLSVFRAKVYIVDVSIMSVELKIDYAPYPESGHNYIYTITLGDVEKIINTAYSISTYPEDTRQVSKDYDGPKKGDFLKNPAVEKSEVYGGEKWVPLKCKPVDSPTKETSDSKKRIKGAVKSGDNIGMSSKVLKGKKRKPK